MLICRLHGVISQKTTIQIILSILIINTAVIWVPHPFSSSPLNGPSLFHYSLTPAQNFLHELSPTTSNLKAEAVCCSETMVTTYKDTQRQYQEDRQPTSSTWETQTEN